MKQIPALFLALALCCPAARAQDDDTDVRDPKAKKILDEVSKTTRSYKNIKAAFTYTLENKDEKVSDTQQGEIILKGEKYNLKIAGQEIIFDGKHIWTYLKSANEVQKSSPEPGGMSPADMFNVYEEGWKFKYIKQKSENGISYDIIDLVPKNADKTFSRVRLTIDGAKKRISEAMFYGKDGTTYTYRLKEMKINVEVGNTVFLFNVKDHPGVEVIDLTEE